ncbi:MAG: hypothetical protein F6K37_29780 [Moorea sp. SIO4E2]|uniref:hypothetical protein n=1 Tax=Moorena sp. SIO4E2 TaxID=2607826 RepID=UPI0013BC7976|nr:hypothetical protein [Moorena sp. SIO4E2]NEQ09975.1 hypothetical protein [Moorena sp. SIO4E2]
MNYVYRYANRHQLSYQLMADHSVETSDILASNGFVACLVIGFPATQIHSLLISSKSLNCTKE